jgi:DNA polymerase III epsilon subunit-like protein
MGGSLRALIRKANGVVQSLTGKTVAADENSDTFDIELPNGDLVRVPAKSAEGVKAVLKSAQNPDGYSKTPAKVKTGDPVVDEKDLIKLDAPAGFSKDESWSPSEDDQKYYGTKIDLGTKYTDDAYDVIKVSSPNAFAKDQFEAAQQREGEGQNVVTEGLGKNGSLDPNLPVYFVSRRGENEKFPFAAVQRWSDVQDYIAQDEPKFEKNELPDPSKMLDEGQEASEPQAPEATPAEGLEGKLVPKSSKKNLKKDQKKYQKALKDYEKSGGTFPLDPTKDHMLLPDGTVVDAETGEVVRNADGTSAKIKPGTEASEVPAGAYKMDDAPYTPQGADADVESADYTDDPAEIAQKFDTPEITDALEKAVDGDGTSQLPFEAGDESVPAEALRDALDEKGEDSKSILAKIYDKIKNKLSGKKEEATPEVPQDVVDELGKDLPESPMPSADADPAKLPALLDGLSDAEKDEYAKTGDYAKHLPKNKDDFDLPEGYGFLDAEPFNKDLFTLPEDAPEGFNFDPIDIANNYDTEALKKELRRAVEPGGDGYGILSQETDTGEDYNGYVPAEAIRDALQLQGEDTNSLLNDIYEEGIAGQEDLTPVEISDALEGEEPETSEGTPTPEQEAPAEAPQQVATDEAGPETVANIGEPSGPAIVESKAGDLKPGDITVGDNFTIENVFSDEESEALKPGSVWVEGYYPGHVTQKTKLWNADTNISVFRNVEPPAKGDLPELSKPKPKEFDPEGKIYKDKVLGVFVPKDGEARSKFLDALDQYNAQMAEAKAKWQEPEGLDKWHSKEDTVSSVPVSNPVAIVEVPAAEVKAGDITFKKEKDAPNYEFFVVEENLGIDPETGQAKLKGFYPGHVSQEKAWNAGTLIKVMRGTQDLPSPGDKPALERPKYADPDYNSKKAAFDKAKAESGAAFTPPIDPETTTAAVPPKPSRPVYPIFGGGEKLKSILAEANGDPAKLKELLNNEVIVSFDFETAANKTKVFNEQKPIQVAVTKTKNGELVEEPLVLWMNPEVPLGDFYKKADSEGILKDTEGNPISDEWLAKQQSISEAFAKIKEYLGDEPVILMGHNISDFDIPILQRHMEEIGETVNIGGTIDTLPLAKKLKFLGDGNKLAEVYAKYFPEKGDLNWHDAATDVSVLPDILNAMLDETALTKNPLVLEDFDIDAAKAKYDAAVADYLASKAKKSKVETDQIMAETVAKGGEGETVDSLIEKVPAELPTKDDLTSATISEVVTTEPDIESVLGGFVSNNYVNDPENVTYLGAVPVEEWKAGDFIAAPNGGYWEVLSIEPDPENDKKVFVNRRLLANGNVYSAENGKINSWVKYAKYGLWRRNSATTEVEPEPELEQPQLETDEAPKKEESAGTWEGYKISQGTDGVYYAENIKSEDVQKLKSGELTPPQTPFFAPLGGGNDQETGEGYFFTTDGKRFWGKYGAAGALVRRKNADGEYEYFLAKRSSSLSQGGGKWGIPGGAHKDQLMAKTPQATSKEEFMEEVGGDLTNLTPIYTDINKVGAEWGYETDVYEVGPNQFKDLSSKDGENTAVGWFTADQITKMADEGKLHSDFADSFPGIIDSVNLDAPTSGKPTTTETVFAEDVSTTFDTSKWVKSGGQGGSNQGAFYTDPQTGQQYYVKKPKSDKHAANEVLGGALYEAAGVKFGRAYLGVDKSGKTVLVSPVIDGSKADLASKKNDETVKKNAQADFAVDAWLANYDAVGLEYDNMLTDGEGNVTRVDAGGSLLFRAQGKNKENFGEEVTELDSMLDSDTNPQAADIFSGMTPDELAESGKKVAAVTPEKIDELVDAAFPEDPETAEMLKSLLKARRTNLMQKLGVEEVAADAPEAVSTTQKVRKLSTADDMQAQIEDAIANGDMILFSYNGKDRLVKPQEIKEGKNGNVNVITVDNTGVIKAFTIGKMEDAEGDGTNVPESSVTKPAPEAEILETPGTPVEKPTELPAAEKQKVLDDLSDVVDGVFGKANTTDELKETLEGLKEGSQNPDLVDSLLSSVDAPEELETAEEKLAADITDLTPEDPELASTPLTVEQAEKVMSDPSLTDPELIWKSVKEDYNGSVLENGHIVVHSVMHGEDRYDVVVRRNESNSFEVYHRITFANGTSKVYFLSKKNHSSEALKNSIADQIYNANSKPKYLKSKTKPETDKSLLPTSEESVPTKKEAHIAADGTVLEEGMTVKIVNPSHSKFGQTAVIKKKRLYWKVGKYVYTDYLNVVYEDGEKNKIRSLSVTPIDSEWKWGDPTPKTDSTPDSATPATPTTAPAEVPATPEASSAPTGESSSPYFTGQSISGAKTLKDVLKKAQEKNSVEHYTYFGAQSQSDYKNVFKPAGMFLKDPESKNMFPGLIASNASPAAGDQDLASHGVITNLNPSDNTVEISYFDGPLAGESKTLPNDKVWSREKFLTIEQAKELDIDVDPSYLKKALQVAKDKAEAYEKELLKKKKQAEIEAQEKALKAEFEVEGGGFEQAPAENKPADWSSSSSDAVPSLASAVSQVKEGNAVVATNGVSALVDADEIEDLEVKVQKVKVKGNKENIRVTFKLTPWAGNGVAAALSNNPEATKSDAIQMTMWETDPESGLLKQGKFFKTGGEDSKRRTVDKYEKGTTITGKAGKGVFNFIRATKDIDDSEVDFTKHYSYSNYTVGLHNRVELLLPADATEKDIADAMSVFGVQSVKPASPEDVKGVVENKLIWLLGKHTTGKKNYKGILREQKLQQIEQEWGVTADDVEVKLDTTGTVEYLLPESVGKKISDFTGIKYFYHKTTGKDFPSDSDGQAEALYKMILRGGILATGQRWDNGLNMGGMSSSEDLRANGGNYVFTYGSHSSKSNGSNSGSPTWNFDAAKLFRKLGYYSTGGDQYGQLKGENFDVMDNMKNNASQIMFKKNLSWADLAVVNMSPAVRKKLIEKLTQGNNEIVSGVNVVDILKEDS